MTVNITNVTNIQDFYGMGTYAARATGGIFWGVILIALFVIIIMRLRHHGIRGIMTAAFSSFALSIIFLNLQFVQLVYPIAFGLILAGTIMANHISPNKD